MKRKLVEPSLQDVSHTDPLETIKRGSHLISSKVGLIRSVGSGIHRAQDPISLALGVHTSDLSHYSDILNASKAGGGGDVIEIALAATIGEAVERYCMLFYDKSTMVYGSYRELREDAASPDLLRLYSREQVERKAPNIQLTYFTEDSKINWVWGYSLTHRQPRLVPATLVYLQYELDDREEPIGRNASTGLAAGATLEEAILVGLYEVIERDAFTICWLHRNAGRRLLIDDAEIQELLSKRFFIDHPKVSFQLYDITLDIPTPSFFALMTRPSEFGPAVCVSSVTRLNPKEVVRKCLREVGQGMSYLRYLNHQLRNWEPAPDFSDLVTFDHHCTLYVKRPELASKALAFCEAVENEVALSQVPDRSTGRVLGDIEYCVEMLKKLEKEVIVVDITTPDISDVDLHVVRVLVPGLVPLHGNYNFPYLGVRRLFDIPHQLSWKESGWDHGAGLNPYPHPFP